MNITQLKAQPKNTKVPSFIGRITAIKPPYPQTADQASKGQHVQDIVVSDFSTNQEITVKIATAGKHLSEPVLGLQMEFLNCLISRFVSAGNKIQYDEEVKSGRTAYHLETVVLWVMGNSDMRVVQAEPTPTPPAPAAPAPVASPPAAPAPVAQPAPLSPALTPLPPPPQEQEMQQEVIEDTGIRIHPRLREFAKAQALCRIAASEEFRAMGLDVGPDQLGGVATSLFIQIGMKGYMDDVIKYSLAPAPARAVPRQAQVQSPPPVAQIQQAPAPQPVAAPAPVPQPAPAAAAPAPAPAAEYSAPAEKAPPQTLAEKSKAKEPPHTQETLMAKYKKTLDAGDMKGPKVSGFAAELAKLGLKWELPGKIVLAAASEKYGQAITDAGWAAVVAKLAKHSDEERYKGIASAPDMFYQYCEIAKKAAKIA